MRAPLGAVCRCCGMETHGMRESLLSTRKNMDTSSSTMTGRSSGRMPMAQSRSAFSTTQARALRPTRNWSQESPFCQHLHLQLRWAIQITCWTRQSDRIMAMTT
ncbi:TPA: hypothetical protein N0F65_012717 [Lagenidium giganteum]|uniref:Uncharacterized protein n=1 Tax=Lagenidium giganteum TaxID=4803 RepID=A0AAV2YGE1_9STRA|nr:TPA: hypothetical protein N0F65_012717 [Lagenidium giganteum]